MKPKMFTKDEIKKMMNDIEIENAQIDKMDIEVLGEFGNAVCLYLPIMFKGNMVAFPFNCISSTLSIGCIIRAIFEVLDIREGNGIKLSEIKKYPCRVAMNNGGVVAIGNFIDDKFIIIEDLFKQFKEYINNLEIK